MSHIIADRVRETSTSTGTGALSLAGATTGYRAFSAVCSTNDTTFYAIEAVDAVGTPTGDWEVGFGTYSGASTLTRTTVFSSSNSNNAVSFGAGTKNVWIDIPAAQVNSQPLNTLTPSSNAGITVDWRYGCTKVTNSGTNVITYANIPSSLIIFHILDVSNLDNTTFPAATDWGVLGKPSCAGRATVILKTNDGGTKVFAAVDWQAV